MIVNAIVPAAEQDFAAGEHRGIQVVAAVVRDLLKLIGTQQRVIDVQDGGGSIAIFIASRTFSKL